MSQDKNQNKKQSNNDTDSCPNGKQACPIYDEITLLRAEVAELRSQVIRDFLTGLYNPRHLDFCLNQEIERTLRSRQPTTLIMLDIDYFKKVNDSYGHAAGDRVLKQVADLLLQSVRKLDVCCRSGGEEFMIILPSTHLLVGIQVAERIRKHLEESLVNIGEEEITITASFGVNTFHYNTQLTQQEFLETVDTELYRAKKAGRNQVCFAPHKEGSTINVGADERAALFGNTADEEPDKN